jgi:uncharacterized protein with GYD domain
MPTYVGLLKFTDQGIKGMKDSLSRAQQAAEQIERMGGRLVSSYWTLGAYDLVTIVETPDEETATAVALATGMQGNVRTETLRAHTAEEMERILPKLP